MPSRVGGALVCLAALAAGGCAWDGPQSSLVPRSDFGRAIVHVYGIVTWAAVLIAAVVFTTLVWVVVRYRDRPDAPPPSTIRGHSAIEVAWTLGPAIVLLVIAVPTIEVVFRTQQAPAAGALHVVVRGHQWWWEFRYPDLGVVTANEVHLPVGRPVVLSLEGADVIHSFWVPPVGGKRDVVPGRLNRLSFTLDAPGEFYGQCAEFCGASHANMRMRLIAEPPADFERWVAAQKAPPREPEGAAAEGKEVYTRLACVGCHTIRGVSAGIMAPDLTHVGSRRTIAAGLLPNSVDNLTAWLLDPAAVKPGVMMPNLGLSRDQARAVAEYLQSLK